MGNWWFAPTVKHLLTGFKASETVAPLEIHGFIYAVRVVFVGGISQLFLLLLDAYWANGGNVCLAAFAEQSGRQAREFRHRIAALSDRHRAGLWHTGLAVGTV